METDVLIKQLEEPRDKTHETLENFPSRKENDEDDDAIWERNPWVEIEDITHLLQVPDMVHTQQPQICAPRVARSRWRTRTFSPQIEGANDRALKKRRSEYNPM